MRQVFNKLRYQMPKSLSAFSIFLSAMRVRVIAFVNFVTAVQTRIFFPEENFSHNANSKLHQKITMCAAMNGRRR